MNHDAVRDITQLVDDLAADREDPNYGSPDFEGVGDWDEILDEVRILDDDLGIEEVEAILDYAHDKLNIEDYEELRDLFRDNCDFQILN